MLVFLCVFLDHMMERGNDCVMWNAREEPFDVVVFPYEVVSIVLVFGEKVVEILECFGSRMSVERFWIDFSC